MQACRLFFSKTIGELDTQAVPLIDSQSQRLDGVALKTAGYGRVALAGAGLGVLGFLGPDPADLTPKHVHPAPGIVVEVCGESVATVLRRPKS